MNSVKYSQWKRPRWGVSREDGTKRTCMHCGKGATSTAVRRQAKFVMDVWFCDDHAEMMKGER